MSDDLVKRLNDACVGHPHAKIQWPHRLLHEAAQRITALEAENARLREALTPSGETKAAYIGEFGFHLEETYGREHYVIVPWTTTKEIMTAIRARAAAQATGDTNATK